MLKKLKIQVICITMTIFTVMLGIIFGLIYHFTCTELEAESLDAMRRAEQTHRRTDPAAKQDPMFPSFSVFLSADGTWSTTPCDFFDVSDEALVKAVIDEALNSRAQHGRIQGQSLRFLKSGKPVGVTIVFADTSMEDAVLSSLTRSGLVVGALCLVIFLGVSAGVSSIVVKPVEKAWRQQKQFVADASHELKTPLTVILTNTELLQSPGWDEPSRRQFTESIRTMSNQMRGLVEGLLNLARVDNGTAQIHFSPLNFSQLVEETVLPFDALFFESGLELSCQTEPGVFLRGSDSHLRQILDVLLDNARKYSSSGGSVQVRLVRQGHCCLLTVANSGEPISPEDLKHIFERFYRVDKTRSRSGGYGLGLSIAQANTELHRGKIWAESSHGVNSFHVQFPIISKSSEEG